MLEVNSKMIRIILFVLFLVTTVCPVKGQEAATIIDDQFAQLPFGQVLTPGNIHKFVSGSFTTKKDTLRNNNTGNIDTLLIFKSASNEFSFLQTPERVLFYGATIVTPDVLLTKDVKIGLSKDRFMDIFGFNQEFSKSDPLVIKDSIEYCYQAFFFKNKKLMRIVLNGCLD